MVVIEIILFNTWNFVFIFTILCSTLERLYKPYKDKSQRRVKEKICIIFLPLVQDKGIKTTSQNKNLHYFFPLVHDPRNLDLSIFQNFYEASFNDNWTSKTTE